MDDKKPATDTAEETPAPVAADSGQAPASSPDTVDVTDTADALAAITAERDRLAAERAEWNDRNLRLRAEFDNHRRRVERERMELSEYAGMEAVRELLPIVDDFERALKVESADKEYVRGMELIYQRLIDVLKKTGLEPIEAEGQKFDPYIHHAVEMTPTDDAEDHTVLAEYRKGYNFKGRLLRPAMVKVAVKPS